MKFFFLILAIAITNINFLEVLWKFQGMEEEHQE